MRTETNVHLRMTRADRYYARPSRLMPYNEWAEYRNKMLRISGFDMTRPITTAGTIFDCIYSQPHLGIHLPI